MHITLVIPTLNQYPRLTKTLQTVHQGTVWPDRTLIIDNGMQLARGIWWSHDLTRDLNLHVLTPPANKGVAGSCNEALRQAQEWWLHSNDDVEWAPDVLEKLSAAAEADQKAHAPQNQSLMFLPDYGVGSAFTLFLMHKSIVDVIGWWDESFFPIYFEDNDFGYRMNLAGVKRRVVEACQYTHHTSSTVRSLDPEAQQAHHRNFEKLKAYYSQKWGGPPEQERFTRPFDGGSQTEVDKTWWARFGREGG